VITESDYRKFRSSYFKKEIKDRGDFREEFFQFFQIPEEDFFAWEHTASLDNEIYDRFICFPASLKSDLIQIGLTSQRFKWNCFENRPLNQDGGFNVTVYAYFSEILFPDGNYDKVVPNENVLNIVKGFLEKI
jgi:hypothetical protein